MRHLAWIRLARSSLSAITMQLNKVRCQANTALARTRNQSAAIYRLPPEIFSEILLFGLAQVREDALRDGARRDPGASYLLCITRVSSHFRYHAVTTRFLWKRLHFQWAPEQLKAWVERAGPSMLLELYYQGKEVWKGGNSLKNIDYISGIFSRFESMHIPNDYLMNRLFDYAARDHKNCFSSLRSITIDATDQSDASTSIGRLLKNLHHDPSKLNCGCKLGPGSNTAVPRLSSISISHGYGLLTFELLKHTTHLSLSNFTGNIPNDITLGMLMGAQALEFLSLDGNGSRKSDWEFPPNHFTMPCLSTLILGRENRRAFINDMLSYMDAPALTSLSIWLPIYDPAAQAEIELTFLRFVSITLLSDAYISILINHRISVAERFHSHHNAQSLGKRSFHSSHPHYSLAAHFSRTDVPPPVLTKAGSAEGSSSGEKNSSTYPSNRSLRKFL